MTPGELRDRADQIIRELRDRRDRGRWWRFDMPTHAELLTCGSAVEALTIAAELCERLDRIASELKRAQDWREATHVER